MLASYAKKLSKYLPDFVLLCGIVGFQLLFLYLFYSRERFIYFWDFGGFASVVNNIAPLFPKNWERILEYLRTSLFTDYNYYYALFLIPIARILGPSRGHYLAGVVFLYQIPFTLAIGFLYNQLVEKRSRLLFWSAVIIAIIIPNTWAPTLRGYPDVVGTFFLCLAMVFYLLRYPEQKWWQYGIAGISLAWSAIFRRYNLYGAVAFYLTAVILLTVDFISCRKWRPFLIRGMLVILSGIVFLATLYLFDEPFLLNVLTTNYYTLYSSYLVDINSTFNFLVFQYGIVFWIFAIFGYVAGFIYHPNNRRSLLFVFLWGIILSSIWIFYVRQAAVQYTLSITIFVAIGLVSFLQFAILKLKLIPRSLLIGLFLIFVGINFLLSFKIYSFSATTPPNFLSRFVSTDIAPKYRYDYGEVMHLIDYMRTIAGNGESIYVADSSYVMNYDILLKGEQQRYPMDDKLNLLITPQIDSRDSYPLEPLILADYVIVSSPLQVHLPKDNQRVVTYVYDAFMNHWDIARDFEEVPVQFQLGTNKEIKLRIYQRIHPTRFETALSTLKHIQEYIPQRPGSQKDWILVSKLSTPGVLTGQEYPNAFTISPEFISGSKKIEFLSIGQVFQQGILSIRLNDLGKNTPNMGFDLFLYDDGQKRNLASFSAVWTEQDKAVINIPYSIDSGKESTHLYMLLQVKKQSDDTRELSGPITMEWMVK